MTRYAELEVTTNFTFLTGGSHPEELVATAKALGLDAIAVTDRNTLAGAVRAHLAAKEAGIKFILGVRLDLQDAPNLLAYPTDRAAYGRLCRLLTLGQRRAGKGQCILFRDDVAAHAEGLIFIVLPPQNYSPHPPTACSGGPLPLPQGERGCRGAASPSPSPLAGEGGDPGFQSGAPGEGEHAKDFESELRRIDEALGERTSLYLAARHSYRGNDRARIAALAELGRRAGVPLVATNAVLYHAPHRRALQDVLTCIREKCTIADAGFRLEANAERHIKSAKDMARLFAGYEDALRRSVEIAQGCTFSLDELKYEYPDEPVPQGKTPQSHLEDLTWEGASWRYPAGIPEKVRGTLHKELALIAELSYAPYFLTVHDIVRYARSCGILCQGRGSAANSAVCYCLAITNVDPTEIDLLFERFVAPERKEPPDIDVDFEHERREEVIQYIYARYGRDRAGLAATVICYRGRLAVREVGKALGLSADTVAALATTIWGLSNSSLPEEYVRQAGLDPSDPLLARVLELTHELIGFPRHLSQHVGGFVLTRGPLSEVVPIGNAAMEDRTVIEWDKDDLDALGLLKVDVLGLGMLTCIRKAFALLKAHYGKDVALGTVPRDDAIVYDMLCRADSIGVFQVESRAQMNMLPRLKPRCFYDLVIEVAIVRPGPIQGDMVHPYLRRRCGEEPVAFPSPHPDHGPADELYQVLGKTMGVPLFQEQAMRLAMVAAKFSGSEANELRRAMATFRRRGTIDRLKEKMVGRMTARGYPADFAERCFNQIKGFGEYGFPESHAASFAHLVYVSAWLKCHYPASFAAALLNSQPMGFYAPAQIVTCARAHGVEAREADINMSLWDCTLDARLRGHDKEPGGRRDSSFALRLGLRQIDGLREDDVRRLVSIRDGLPADLDPHLFCPPPMSSPGLTGRSSNPEPPEDQGLLDARLRGHDQGELRGRYADVRDLWRRSGLKRASLERLAAADAFRSLGLHRRQALWDVRGLPLELPLPLFDHAGTADAGAEQEVTLPLMPLSEHVVNDYRTLRLSLKAHPVSFLRARIAASGIAACADLKACRDGAKVSVAGVVLVRQRPGSAQGVVFMTIEDETGIANSVIWPNVLERERKVVMGARLVVVHGRIQRHEDIIHVVAVRLEDRSDWLHLLTEDGEALSLALANADEVRRPEPGSWRSSRDNRPSFFPPLDGEGGSAEGRAGWGDPAETHPTRRKAPTSPPGGGIEHVAPRAKRAMHPRRHPRAERIIPKSRDFH
ncbi:MAG: error-prone DNA polymerase [Methyloceanibacter sp.]|nr:error-prone DNA polymerase [Methyloceanibacter sp.]